MPSKWVDELGKGGGDPRTLVQKPEGMRSFWKLRCSWKDAI